MRPRLIFFTLLGAAFLAVPATAQSNQDRCAILRTEMDRVDREAGGEASIAEKALHALGTAMRRSEALEGAAEHPVLTALLDEEPYSAKGMLRFREEHALSSDLVSVANSGRPREFWRLADAELKRAADKSEALFSLIVKRLTELSLEYDNLNCAGLPRSPLQPPLAVQHRSDGQPIITDELITRWVKATYALKNTGGAYWQAGRMTQQDYIEVDRRINLYFDIANSGRAAEQFSDDEMRALNPRLTDIRNVRVGNWSLIKL